MKQKIKRNYKFYLAIIALFVGGVFLFGKLASVATLAMLSPKGVIAQQQRDIIVTAVLLMLVAVVPILIFAYYVAWKYRAEMKSKYEPDVDGNKILQIGWFVLISSIIFVIAIIAFRGAHKLDPRKPIVSSTPPLTIQAVALEWKWLFIYPELGVSTVNFVTFPKDTPVVFEITADAPMNSLWIPELGGQMYAMNGMRTKLHLMAAETGSYQGRSSNISGEGFATMNFEVKTTTTEDFNRWLQAVENSKNKLTMSVYNELAKPSEDLKPIYFSATEENLFDEIMMKYMAPYSMPAVHGTIHTH